MIIEKEGEKEGRKKEGEREGGGERQRKKNKITHYLPMDSDDQNFLQKQSTTTFVLPSNSAHSHKAIHHSSHTHTHTCAHKHTHTHTHTHTCAHTHTQTQIQ